MKATTEQIQKFHVLLYRTHMLGQKQYMLRAYGVESTKDLSSDEINELITHLESLEAEKSAQNSKEVRQWRHKVLRMIAECGIDTQDWNKVNDFMMDSRIAGKLIYMHTVPELKVLHRKLHSVAEEKKKRRKAELLQASKN